MELVRDIWNDFRPYLVKIVADFLVSATLWLVLFVFHYLTSWFRIEGVPARFIQAIHSGSVVAVFLIFAFLFAADLYRIHGKQL